MTSWHAYKWVLYALHDMWTRTQLGVVLYPVAMGIAMGMQYAQLLCMPR